MEMASGGVDAAPRFNAAVHSRLLRELRVRMLEEAADAGIDLIAT